MRRVAAWCGLLGVLFGAVACGGGTQQTSSPAPSSSTVAPAPGKHWLTLEHGGATRKYRVHAPAGYDPARPVPLVIAMHPYPGNGSAMIGMTGLDEMAARENFLVAYPDGVAGGFNALVCCGAADDVGFLKAITEHLVADWRVDRTGST